MRVKTAVFRPFYLHSFLNHFKGLTLSYDYEVMFTFSCFPPGCQNLSTKIIIFFKVNIAQKHLWNSSFMADLSVT